ncbi:hypothetical protein BUY26_13085, partial [Staphylococcus cohnii]
KEYNTFNFPSHYSQKTSASFRNMSLVSPFVYLYIEAIGYHINSIKKIANIKFIKIIIYT